MTKSSSNSGSHIPSSGLIVHLTLAILGGALGLYIPTIPAPDPSSLIRDAALAIEEVAGDSEWCVEKKESQAGEASSKRGYGLPSSEANRHFERVVQVVNELSDQLQERSPAEIFYHCPVSVGSTSFDGEILSRQQKITALAAAGINSTDSILELHSRDDALPKHPSANLKSLRDSLLIIGYMEGNRALRVITSLVDGLTILAALVYGIITLVAIRASNSEERNLLEGLLLSCAILSLFVSLRLAPLYWFSSTYGILVFLALSLFYTHVSLASHRKQGEVESEAYSLFKMFRWGLAYYAVILLAVSLPYWQASYSVGSYPLWPLAKLNVANFFFAITLGVVGFSGLALSRKMSRWWSLSWAAIIIGPGAFAIAVGSYLLQLDQPSYPGNLLYGLLTRESGDYIHPAVPPAIEITLARLMVSLPLLALISKKMLDRYQQIKPIESFLGDGPEGTLKLSLAPGLRVHLDRKGILIPNSKEVNDGSAEFVPNMASSADEQFSPGPPPDEAKEAALHHRANRQFRGLLISARPGNIVMAMALTAISYVLAGGGPELLIILPLVLSTAAAVAGSFILNDVVDVHIDKVNRPARPFASGALPISSGLVCGLVAVISAPVLGLLVNTELALFWMIVSGLSVLYSIAIKPRAGVLANLLSASLTTSICFVGIFAAGRPYDVLAIALVVFLACLAREIAKDVEDLRGDASLRRGTLPMLVGTKASLLGAKSLVVLQVLFSLSASARELFGAGYYLPGIAAVNAFLIWGLVKYRSSTAESATRLQRLVKRSMAGYLFVYLIALAL